MKNLVGNALGRLLGWLLVKRNLLKPNLNTEEFFDLREREAVRREFENRRYYNGVFL